MLIQKICLIFFHYACTTNCIHFVNKFLLIKAQCNFHNSLINNQTHPSQFIKNWYAKHSSNSLQIFNDLFHSFAQE